VPVDAHSRSAIFRNEDLDKEVVSKRESNHGMAEILGGLFDAYGQLGDIL
jgi:DNA-binding transcriptional regulator LsrR (DeoR family)